MRPNLIKSRTSGSDGALTAAVAVVLSLLFVTLPGGAAAQAAAAPDPAALWDFFGTEFGDPYSSVFLNQVFGPLFPSASGSDADSLLAEIIAYFNMITLLIGGLMFFYNVTVGVLQTAHEGSVLGQRWSSLWAPLRIIFAVGMLVPVNEGYNLAHSGIAFVVDGSTRMASAVWSSTASAVISDDIPLAAPVTNFDTATMSSLYEQAACIEAVSRQVTAANPDAHVGWVPGNFDERVSRTTAIYDGENYVDHGICGSWKTPPLPAYLQNAIDGYDEDLVEEASISGSVAENLIDTFRDGHEQIMLDASASLQSLVNAMYPGMVGDNPSTPSIADQIRNVHIEATQALAALNTDLRNQVTSTNGIVRGRDSLLTRVTGGESCFSGSGGLQNVDTEREASVACYGEGWMGAGSWYILMAKLNNELSTLMDAKSTTSSPSYKSQFTTPSQLYRSAGGEGSSWFFGGVTEEDLEGMPSLAMTQNAMIQYQDAYEQASLELAALGYQIPTNILNEIDRDANGDNASFWASIMPEDMMDATTGALMSFFDPGATESDPMVGLIQIGHFLINIGTSIVVATAATGFFTGGGAAVAMLPVYSVFLSAGVSLSFILPIMPFLYWVLAVMGYFLLIAEAIIAVNLWALSHLRMDGEGFSGEGGRMGWLMLLSLFMTPTLMVFGFIIGMVLFRIASDLISAGLFYAVSGLTGANPVIWIFGTLGYSVLIVTAYGLLLERSFSLVSEFPSRVMKWMGQQVDMNNGEARIQAAGAAAAYGVNQAGNHIEKGMGQVGSDGKFVHGVGAAGKLRSFGEKIRPGRGLTKGGS